MRTLLGILWLGFTLIFSAPSAFSQSDDDFDYSIIAGCSTYHGLSNTPFSWFSTWGEWAASLELFLTDDQGRITRSLVKLPSPGYDGDNIAYRYTDPLLQNPSGADQFQAFSKVIRENIDKNLLFRCTYVNPTTGYSQNFHLFAPLKGRNEWRGSLRYYWNQPPVNQLVFEVNHLSDLYYRVYLAFLPFASGQEEAIQNLDTAFRALFPGAYFRGFEVGDMPGGVYYPSSIANSITRALRDAGTTQNATHMLLRGLANEYTNTSVETVNKMVADEVGRQLAAHNGSGRCAQPWVCAAFLSSTELLTNPKFLDDLSGWQVTQNLYGNANGYVDTQYGLDANHTLTLKLDVDNMGNQMSSIAVEQSVQVDPKNLDRMHLLFSTGKVTGGSNIFGGFSAYSGISGVYFCAKRNEVQLGCWFASYFTDSITIPVNVGLIYDPTSSKSFKYAAISPVRHRQLVNLGKVIRRDLPAVNPDDITSITVGAEVTESFGKYGNVCRKCYASIEVNELSLRLTP